MGNSSTSSTPVCAYSEPEVEVDTARSRRCCQEAAQEAGKVSFESAESCKCSVGPTCLRCVFPIRFAIDLLHIIWLAIVLRPYASAWKDAGASPTEPEACMVLFDWETKLLLWEIVLLAVDPAAAFCAGILSYKWFSKKAEDALTCSLLSLVPSYVFRLGFIVSGMVTAGSALNAADRGTCNDMWLLAGISLFICTTYIICFWTFFAVSAYLRRGDGVTSREELNADTLGKWASASWNGHQVSTHLIGTINAFIMILKYRAAADMDPTFQKVAGVICIGYVSCVLLAVIVCSGVSCRDDGAQIPLSRLRPCEFLSLFFRCSSEEIDPSKETSRKMRSLEIALKVAWTLFWGLFLLLQTTDMVASFGEQRSILAESDVAQVQVALTVFNVAQGFLQVFAVLVLACAVFFITVLSDALQGPKQGLLRALKWMNA